jgi:hypothetical protein
MESMEWQQTHQLSKDQTLKKQLNVDLSLYTILQILSLTLFEKTPILHVLTEFTSIGGNGNVGIIRSPVRAIALLDRW